jgi:16S rRNA uridine-516 pseudouridylate synthase and related pseudouridylate synthases
MRINKFISEAGKSSRRGADKLITEGRVFVNGKRAKLGIRVEPGDDVRVDGNPIYIARN